MTVAQILKGLFESDLEAPDYLETTPGYDLHRELGWRPDYPELNEVWRSETPPENAPAAIRENWAAARADVMALYEDYCR